MENNWSRSTQIQASLLYQFIKLPMNHALCFSRCSIVPPTRHLLLNAYLLVFNSFITPYSLYGKKYFVLYFLVT